MKTTNEKLQAKLEELVALADAGDRAKFVAAFVPLDLTDREAAKYLGELTTGSDAESQWTNLVVELKAMADGETVTKITGDQKKTATFYFVHPLYEMCDREATFTCVNDEWRADA